MNCCNLLMTPSKNYKKVTAKHFGFCCRKCEGLVKNHWLIEIIEKSINFKLISKNIYSILCEIISYEKYNSVSII